MNRPILFSAPMVRALLDGRKTQTRRMLKVRKGLTLQELVERGLKIDNAYYATRDMVQEPRFDVGDRLWVKETWAHDAPDIETCRCAFEDAIGGGMTYGPYYRATEIAPETLRWRPSIFMPRWASRLTLTVTDVRVQRLQDISEEDAIAEGVPDVLEGGIGDEVYCPTCNGMGVHGALGYGYGVTEVDCRDCETAVQRYHNLWNSINGAGSWEANPFVVAVSFTVERRNIDG